MLDTVTLRLRSHSQMTTVFAKVVSACVGLIYLSHVDRNYAHWVRMWLTLCSYSTWCTVGFFTEYWIVIYRNQFKNSKIGLYTVKLLFNSRNYWENLQFRKECGILGAILSYRKTPRVSWVCFLSITHRNRAVNSEINGMHMEKGKSMVYMPYSFGMFL